MERLQIHSSKGPDVEKHISDLKAKLGYLLSKGPSDSSLCCCFAKEDPLFVINLRIHSAHGHFPLHLENSDPQVLISKTIAEIQKQFHNWHDNPKKYGDEHAMGAQACTHCDGKVLKCPIGSPANRPFET